MAVPNMDACMQLRRVDAFRLGQKHVSRHCEMASITSPTSTDQAISWSGRVREALAVPGVVLTLRDWFDVRVANNLLKLESVPADDKKRLKAFLRHSARDTESGLQYTRGEYTFSQRCQSSAIGRLYPRHHPTLGSLQKDLRNALAAQYYLDLDIKNSHPSIVRQIAKRYGWSCASLDAYVGNREAVLEAIRDDYGLTSRNDAKTLVLKVINSAAVPECRPGASGRCLHQLKQEVTAIANNIYKHADFVEYAKLARKKKGAVTCLSDVVSDVEYDLLMEVVDYVHKQKREIGSLIMDGCTVRKCHEAETELSPQFTKEVELQVLKKTGFDIELTCKPMESEYATELKAAAEAELPQEFQGMGLLCGAVYQPDKPVSNLIQHVVGAELRQILRYTGPNMPWQFYDASRGVWMPVCTPFAASVLQDKYMVWYQSDLSSCIPADYWSEATHCRILSLRTARDILGLMTGFLHDPDMLDRLDSKISEGLIPFNNTCVRVEPAGIRIVPHSPDNFITKTSNYDLPLPARSSGGAMAQPPDDLDFTAVDDFYINYWSDETKRVTVLHTLGAMLLPQMRPQQKFITICTDTANGNTGKSVFSDVFMDTMDILAQPLQPALVYDSAGLGSRNGHGANELSYRGAYTAILDEMKSERRFDMEALKKLAGGGIKLSCRMLGSAKTVTFPWLALPILLCNQKCLPQMDSTNEVDLGRFRFICFETRFITPSGAGVPDGYDVGLVKVGKEGVATDMQAHRGAHMWRLLQAAHQVCMKGGAVSNEEWPEDWKQLKESATVAADPLATVVQEMILANVEKGVVRGKGEEFMQGGKMVKADASTVDCILRQRLVDAVMRNSSIRASVQEVKDRLDSHMATLGYPFFVDKTVHCTRIKLSYLGCKWSQHDDSGDCW